MDDDQLVDAGLGEEEELDEELLDDSGLIEADPEEELGIADEKDEDDEGLAEDDYKEEA